jgi:hypothetical protein
MNELKNILKIFYINYHNDKTDWYHWVVKDIYLPKGIELTNESKVKRNLQLKEKLHSMWIQSNEETKGNLIEFYIVKWGGIKTNRTDSLNIYKTNSASDLINRGKRGVSSWSKALVVHDCNKYAIFDARVSSSLNILQILAKNENKVLFPILSSRNNIIIKGNLKIKEISMNESWSKLSNNNFYTEYINLLKIVAEELNTNISTIEMLLFAKAENLVIELINLNNLK